MLDICFAWFKLCFESPKVPFESFHFGHRRREFVTCRGKCLSFVGRVDWYLECRYGPFGVSYGPLKVRHVSSHVRDESSPIRGRSLKIRYVLLQAPIDR